MRNLLLFIARFHAFLLFLLLEGICLVLIIRYNNFQRASILNSANDVTGNLLQRASDARDYIDLSEVNDSLAAANAKLIQQLMALENVLSNRQLESVPDGVNLITTDTLKKLTYQYISAKTINNSIYGVSNYITINKGRLHNIRSEMGVIGPHGIVGVVKDVSDNFSTIISVLHQSLRISAKIKRSNFVGSLRWNAVSPQYAKLDDIPKHASVYVGDTVVTSGYSSFFPAQVPIGVIEEWSPSSQGSNFYNIKVKLATDFNNLNYLYVVDYTQKREQQGLENKTASE